MKETKLTSLHFYQGEDPLKNQRSLEYLKKLCIQNQTFILEEMPEKRKRVVLRIETEARHLTLEGATSVQMFCLMDKMIKKEKHQLENIFILTGAKDFFSS